MHENCDNNEPSNRTKYQYDAGGDVTQITYPSGRVVQYAYNNVGQLCEIAATASGCSDSTYYAGGFSYNSPGKLAGFTYGNGVTAAFTYSAPRTQLSTLAYAKGNSPQYFSLQYWYQQNSPNCGNGTTRDNGTIQCITDGVDSGRNANYSYDWLGRMIAESTVGDSAYPQWGLAQTYDRYGNRLSQTVTAGSGPQTSMSFNNNNQPTDYTYDASGNMTVEPLSTPNQYSYDSENRMTAVSGGGSGQYVYAGNGQRIFRMAYSLGIYRASVYSGSQVLAEYDNENEDPSTPAVEYIYNPASEGLLASISSGAITYYHQDQLSVRLTTDANGNVLTQQGTYPFGEPWYSSSNLGPGDNWVFTSYDRDQESGLDYALARYYDSRTGTFCSADPLAGDPSDPQSWNRYPYGRNDPIDITDPSGQHWYNWLFNIALAVLAPEAAPFIYTQEAIAYDQPPWGFNPAGGFGGGAAGTSWNGTPENMPNPGIEGALGLPTMADVGGPTMNATDSTATDCAGKLTSSVSAFLKSQKVPAAWSNKAGIIVQDALQQQTDPRLVSSILALESGNGKHFSHNNPFGLGPGNHYRSPDSAIAADATTLNNHIYGPANQTTVADLYSGKGGIYTGRWHENVQQYPAYCTGPGCVAGGKTVAAFMTSQGGDPNALNKSPCP